MKKKQFSWLLILIFIQQGVFAQFIDDFNDGDFTSSPPWSGSVADFQVNATNQLQLNNSVASTSYLSASNSMASLDNMEWQFWLQQSFSPSGSNYGRVYLVSDQADLTGNLNGYFIQFGEAGSADAIELFRQDGASVTSVARGTDGTIASSFQVRVRVRRDASGNWTLDVDFSGGNTFSLHASGTDATYTSSAHIGVFCAYTASNADKFYYDDFYAGPYILDTTPPSVTGLAVLSATELDVQFTEAVDQATAELVTNYAVNNGIGNPSGAVLDGVDPSLVHLTFGNAFTNGATYLLTTTNVQDLSANAMSAQDLPFSYIVSGVPVYREVVINEIFADPSPQLGMPDAEFIELHNTGTQIFDLQGWSIEDASSSASLDSYILLPGEYVVLCAPADTGMFFWNNNVLGVGSFPSLNNSSDDLKLRDDQGNLIDRVIYSDTWYRDEIKQEGGWTLEQINPNLPCAQASNWIGSTDANNGTPGWQNSVYNTAPDVTAPSMTNVFVESVSIVKIALSESVDSLITANASYSISNGITVTGVSLPETLDSVMLLVSPALSQGIFYTLTMSGAQDCSGNTQPAESRQFILPEDPAPGDVIINEVLFNPASGGTDYVELYNRSNKYLSLEGWFLADWEDSVSNLKPITDRFFLFGPGEFALISEDSNYVIETFPFAAAGTFINTDLPSYPDDSATVYVLTPNRVVSDRFAYDEDYHFSLLKSVENVSLERIDYNRPSSDRTNWHSAAESQHFGTPGYQNSVYAEGMVMGQVAVSPETFSPDNDGLDDVLNITYEFAEPGAVATIHIYDNRGRLVRTLIENELMGVSGTYSWDGITDDRTLARVGIYVVVFDWYFEDGTTGKKKLACVLAQKL